MGILIPIGVVMRITVASLLVLFLTSGASAQEQPAPHIVAMQWAVRPALTDYVRLYPPEAVDARVAGQVRLDCIVQADQTLQCAVLGEEPQGYGFARAALEIASIYRAVPEINGTPTTMGRVVTVVRWNPDIIRALDRR